MKTVASDKSQVVSRKTLTAKGLPLATYDLPLTTLAVGKVGKPPSIQKQHSSVFLLIVFGAVDSKVERFKGCKVAFLEKIGQNATPRLSDFRFGRSRRLRERPKRKSDKSKISFAEPTFRRSRLATNHLTI
ncbi:MAG: hypothetical protein MUD08_03865 [Cytophagales bacterium]|nr:hypothetical protein [Cytophagales bacterium]